MALCAKYIVVSSDQYTDLLNSSSFFNFDLIFKNFDLIYSHDSLINQFTMIPNSYNDSTIFLPNSRKSSIRFMIASIFTRNIIFILFSYDKKKKMIVSN